MGKRNYPIIYRPCPTANIWNRAIFCVKNREIVIAAVIIKSEYLIEKKKDPRVIRRQEFFF